MVTSNPDRFALYEMMREAWGQPLATALMDQLPTMDTTDIATRQDIENMAIQLRGEMAELRGDLRGEMAELRGEFRASSRHTIVAIVASAVSIWLSFYLPNVL